jgi:cellulose synthase/poly-beta-1,6-N-acetylglucosamine synthase-like glycosyltransferase
MSLVNSAFNEDAVIRRKLENALSLDYPAGLLEIVVVSDASDDGTDAIVSEFAGRGVVLHRQAERRGKTAGLNRTVPLLLGEFVVFSDANAMYEPDALRKLARNFADPEVGCVTGEARYLPGSGVAAEVGERAYWDYEIQIKRLETDLGSMVGGDGAIYAIRRSLWRNLPEDAINDFLNPLQIVAGGRRAVYEPEAICYEETAGGMRAEYRRRVRIVSRSWRAIFQAPGVLNPLRVGHFTWCLISHKILRWGGGVALVLAFTSLVNLYVETVARWPLASSGVLLLAGAMGIGTRTGRRASAMSAYFAVINAASLVGLFNGSFGRVSGVWSTPRQRSASRRRARSTHDVPVGRLFLATSVTVAAVAVLGAVRGDAFESEARVLFWSASALLTYVYVGYPALLSVLGKLAIRRRRTAPIQPSVCLFVPANDEEPVMKAKLQNALAADYPHHLLDIVVASDGSVDRTNAIVREFSPRVRLLDLIPRRGKVAAINEGMRSVRSDIIVFSDANTFLHPGAIRALVHNFADPEVGAVSGDVILEGQRAHLGRSEDLYYRYERWVQAAESNIGSMVGVDGALYAIRRELFTSPPDDTVLDDMAISMAVIRAGCRVIFEPAARAHERGSETAKEEFARKSRVMAGAVQFLTRRESSLPPGSIQVMFSLISHKALRWLSPAFAACALVSAMTLAPVSSTYLAAAIAQGVVLLLGTAGCIPTFRRNTAVGLAHYFCLVQVAAAAGIIRGLSGTQSVRWRRFGRVPVEPAEPVELA